MRCFRKCGLLLHKKSTSSILAKTRTYLQCIQVQLFFIRKQSTKLPPSPPPEGLCCGSGCDRCVWVIYAEELATYYNDGGEKAFEALKLVPDSNVREFLKMDLKLRLKKLKMEKT